MMTTDGSRFTRISKVLEEFTGSPVAIQLESRKFSDAPPKASPASTRTLYPSPDSLTVHVEFEIAPAVAALKAMTDPSTERIKPTKQALRHITKLPRY